MLFIFFFAFISFTLAEDVRNETFNGTMMSDFVAPTAACPFDTVPYLENGNTKTCQPGVSTTCPPGAMCYNDNIFNGYICCLKLLGYCNVGQPYIDPTTNTPKTCKTSSNSSCLAPFTCQSKTATAVDGYCCPDSLGMEPPPVGCPWGSRPMKDETGTELPCVAGSTNSCPGNSICYTDSTATSAKCCGVDPGEGCPSGTKPVKNNGEVRQCVPGDQAQQCPGVSVCQWNYRIDRYQCCVTDNGCPDEMVPYVDSNNKIAKCNLGQPNACQPNFSCEFNFWVSTYQCCGRSLGFCPATQVASLDSNGLMQACYTYDDLSCSSGYSCKISSTNQPICCAAPGKPSAGYKFSTDANGRYKSCLPNVATSCTLPSVCIAAVGGPSGLFVCSERISRCPNGKSAYPSEADPAICMFNTNCPDGYTCDLALSGTSSICCGTAAQVTTSAPTTQVSAIQCPTNYTPQSGVYVPCTASWSNSCLKDATCLQSPNVPGIFLCCMPTQSPISQRTCTQSGLYYWSQNQAPQTCNPNYIFTGCPTTHSMCLNYPALNGFYCCKVDLCSNGGEPCWLLGSTIPQYCGSGLSPCPSGYTCLSSNFFGANICCKQRLWLANDDHNSQFSLEKPINDVQREKEIGHMANLLQKSSSIFLAVDEPKRD